MKKKNTMEWSDTWTFNIDDDEVIKRGFMDKIIKDMKKQRKAKGNKTAPKILFNIKNNKNESNTSRTKRV